MPHMRYWAMTLMAATAGGFLAIDQYAFAASHVVLIAFAVTIAAGVCSLAGTAIAFVRQNHRLSKLSAMSALIAAFTIIATRAFTAPTALWLAFAKVSSLAPRPLAVKEVCPTDVAARMVGAAADYQV